MTASFKAGPRAVQAMPHTEICVAALLVVSALLMSAVASAASLSDPARAYLDALSATLPLPARETVRKIDGPRRQVLAVRSYVRVGEELTQRWSWTAEQRREFEGSAQHRQLLASIAAVTARFEAENPGYSLFANTQVRSLELQLERWNKNPRVASVADELYSSLLRELRTQHYPQRPDADSLGRCKAFLIGWRPSVAAPLAAPGLSAHGQLRAVDFQVRRGEQIVAGTNVAAVPREWTSKGWARRLQRAVSSLNGSFTGPLQSPNEPWHYSYSQ